MRKLLPESWGFMCPVHTPDGSPCGLLNHLTAACKVAGTGPEVPEDSDEGIATVRLTLSHSLLSNLVPNLLPERRTCTWILTWQTTYQAGNLDLTRTPKFAKSWVVVRDVALFRPALQLWELVVCMPHQHQHGCKGLFHTSRLHR